MLKDYYKDIYFLEVSRTPDGFGGWSYTWTVGASFKGLVTLSSDTVQNTEALRGNLKKQYNVSAPIGTPLKKGDKIKFDENGETEYAEITNDGVTPPATASTQFVLFKAQAWEKQS